MSSSELACVYAAIVLHDDGLEVSADNISALVKAAGVEVEPYWPSLFAKLVQGKDIGEMLASIGSAGPAPVAAAAAPAGAAGGGGGGGAAAKAPEPEPEEEEEDMGFDLFD